MSFACCCAYSLALGNTHTVPMLAWIAEYRKAVVAKYEESGEKVAVKK